MHRPAPLVLQDAWKHFCHDQEKIIPPEETVQRFKARVSASGLNILEEVVRIDNGRLDIPVYFSVCGSDALAAIGNTKQMGKGATPSQSQASAVMELGERFSLFSFHRNPANFRISPAKAIKDPKIDFHWIAQSVSGDSDDPERVRTFFEELPLKWTWAHNLTRNERVLVPFNWFYTINEFNGSSAGNCNEEALCQGICEIVERHVCALVSRRQVKTPRINPAGIKDPTALELLTKYRNAGIELCLSDFTAAMGIPTVGAMAWDPASFPRRSEIVWTAGTTPSPAKALCRALTEVAQLAGDFNTDANYVACGLPKPHDLSEVRFVTHPGRTTELNRLPDISHDNIKIEIEKCIAALAERRMDVFVVDLHHPALQIPAFYTIIPGTRFRERATHSSVAMICAKIATESLPAEQAVVELQRLDGLVPDKYYTQFYMGQLYQRLNDHPQAIGYFRKALALSPPDEDRAAVYTYLGLGHKELGQHREALQELHRADAIDPERTDTLNLMGFCHYKQHAYAEAIDCFKKIIALNPSSAIDYANLASNYRALGDRANAIENYRVALTLDPGIEFARQHLIQMGADD
jgi:ribosomal protein S12 methylthiotransferase accessory factor